MRPRLKLTTEGAVKLSSLLVSVSGLAAVVCLFLGKTAAALAAAGVMFIGCVLCIRVLKNIDNNKE